MTQRSDRGVIKSRPVSGIFVILAFCYSLYTGYQGWGIRIPDTGPWPSIKIKQLTFLALWTLLPPIWFFCEYFFGYLRQWKPNTAPPADFDVFKYGQELAGRMWIAASSVLAVLYFGKDIKL